MAASHLELEALVNDWQTTGIELSNEKSGYQTVVLGFGGDEILPRYIGIIMSHYKDPY